MKTQNKLLIILVISAMIMFAGFLIILDIQKRQTSILLSSGEAQQQKILETAIEARAEVIGRTVYDYTYWDDLVYYLHAPDPLFANDNLKTLFSSFGANVVWMFNIRQESIFASAFIQDTIAPFAEIPKGMFDVVMKKKIALFYLNTEYGILEVHAATMHGSNDEAREKEAFGYFFVGKLLDSAWMESVNQLTEGKINIIEKITPDDSPQGDEIVVEYPLNDWQGNTVSWVRLSRNYEFITVFKKLSHFSTYFLAGMVIVILAIFFMSFNFLVKKPLSTISSALASRSSTDRQKLGMLRSEFHKIGQMIEEYFEQQESLEMEIEVRKKTEAQKEKLINELDIANKELKDFAYIVSHDLKAPLRAIGSITQWIHTDYHDKLDDDGRMQLDLLLSRVHRMQNLIEGVLAYSRVSRVKEEKETIDLNKLVKEAIEMVSPPEKFTVIADENLPVVKYGPTRLLQIFQNLISNAVKYNNKATGIIEIRCAENQHDWAISITDNGPGIEEKYFEKIFQIFQTLKARDEFESTGIGLTIVKKIIESNGGKISVSSIPGEQTTFIFTILK